MTNKNTNTPDNAIVVPTLKKAVAVAVCHEFGEIGLVVRKDAEDAEIVKLAGAIGEFTGRLDQSRRWWIGDLVLAANSRSDELFTAVCAAGNITRRDAQNCVTVAKRIPLEDRIAGLSWSTHREVVPVDDRQARNEILRKAAEEGLSSRDVAALVAAWQVANGKKHVKDVPAPATADDTGHAMTPTVSETSMYDVLWFIRSADLNTVNRLVAACNSRLEIMSQGMGETESNDAFDAAMRAVDEALAN